MTVETKVENQSKADGDYQNVKIEREDGITFVMLNRPEKRNAMSPALHYEMEDVISRLATDKESKVLILGGVGESWCAGQDLKLYFRETANNPDERRRSNAASHRWRWELLNPWLESPTPSSLTRIGAGSIVRTRYRLLCVPGSRPWCRSR